MATLNAAWSSLRDPISFSANDTLLPSTLAQQGIEFAGDDSHIACVRSSIASGHPVSVVALGGSISAGSSYSVRYGGSGAWLYHSKLARALANVTRGNVTHHNGALPATGPAFFEHCVDGQLGTFPGRAARLILVEFGVNTDGQPAAFERLLRKLLALRPSAAILVVNTHVWTLKGQYRTCWQGAKRSKWSMREPEQLAEQTWEDRFNFGDEDVIARLCKHYNVPLVSMRAALLDAVKRDDNPLTRLAHFMVDCKHPSGQGHTYLAQLALTRLLGAPSGADRPAAAIGKASASSLGCRLTDGDSPQRDLPAPMFADGFPRGVSRCLHGDLMRTLPDLASRGFAFTDEGRNKFGWVGTRPGDNIGFCLLGDARGTPGLGPLSPGATATGRRRLWEDGSTRAALPSWHGRRLAHPARCIDKGRRGHTREQAAAFCREQQGNCGEVGVIKRPGEPPVDLLKACPASCGMCPASLPSEPPAATATSSTAGPALREVGLWIGYLSSYEHMGRARLTCNGGCECAPSDIDAFVPPSPDRPRVSVTAVRRVALLLPNTSAASGMVRNGQGLSHDACCRLQLRIKNATSSGSHKFKLMAILLAEASGNEKWQPPGVKVGASRVLHMMNGATHAEEAEQRRPYSPEGRVPPKIRRAARGGKGGGQRKGGGDAAAVAAEQRLLARNHVRMKNFLRKRGQPTCNAAASNPCLLVLRLALFDRRLAFESRLATGGSDSVLLQRVLSIAEARLARLGEKPGTDGGVAISTKERSARQAQIALAAAGRQASG